jgi:hypothetical protein
MRRDWIVAKYTVLKTLWLTLLEKNLRAKHDEFNFKLSILVWIEKLKLESMVMPRNLQEILSA